MLDRLAPRQGIEEISVTTEDEYFPPPRQLRELLGAITGFAAASLGAEPPDGIGADRLVEASSVLQ